MGFSRQEYGVGCHFLLQGIFPTQGSNRIARRALLSELPGKSRCFFTASLKRIISPKCFKFNWETNHNCIKAIHLSLHKNFFGKHLCINLTSEVATLASWMTLRIQSCKRRGVFATVLVSVCLERYSDITGDRWISLVIAQSQQTYSFDKITTIKNMGSRMILLGRLCDHGHVTSPL